MLWVCPWLQKCLINNARIKRPKRLKQTQGSSDSKGQCEGRNQLLRLDCLLFAVCFFGKTMEVETMKLSCSCKPMQT